MLVLISNLRICSRNKITRAILIFLYELIASMCRITTRSGSVSMRESWGDKSASENISSTKHVKANDSGVDIVWVANWKGVGSKSGHTKYVAVKAIRGRSRAQETFD